MSSRGIKKIVTSPVLQLKKLMTFLSTTFRNTYKYFTFWLNKNIYLTHYYYYRHIGACNTGNRPVKSRVREIAYGLGGSS